MVKSPVKPQGITNTSQNGSNITSKLDSKLSKNQDIKDIKEYKPTLKSKQQIDKENYQKNKEKKRLSRRKDIIERSNKLN
jgi:hypothetical protein